MNDKIFTLDQLPLGHEGAVVSLESAGCQRRRMMDLGLNRGTAVKALHRSPSGDPVAYYIKGAVIALRNEDAEKILITSMNE